MRTGTWRAAFKGFGGSCVMVALTLDDNSDHRASRSATISLPSIEGYGAQALEPAFQEQFIGKTLPLTTAMWTAIPAARP